MSSLRHALRAGRSRAWTLTSPRSTGTIHEPLLRLIEELRMKFGELPMAVLIPEIVETRWLQYLLHTHRGRRLRLQLLQSWKGRSDGGRNVPWHLDRD